MQTLDDGCIGDVLGWLREPAEDRGIRLAGKTGWRFHSYRELSRQANGTAHLIGGYGLGPDARIGVAATDPVRFAANFFGVLAAGATAVTIAPPTALGQAYPAYAAHLLRTAQVSAVLAPEEMQAPMADALARAGLAVPVLHGSPEPADEPPPTRPSGLALIQFTSGSTSEPRGVMVSAAALAAQVRGLACWLGWNRCDATASWLPLHHDMGLVGAFMIPVCHGNDLWQMSPTDFIRDPASFLRCIGENGITTTVSPTFGFAHMARRVSPGQLAGTDFTAFRAAIASAERVDPAAMASFAGLLSGHGFRWDGVRCAYGLAEATLAVSGARSPTVVEVDWHGLRMGAKVAYTDTGPLAPGHSQSSAGLVSCGTPLPHTRVWVAGEAGRPLPQGYLGEIVVSGPSVVEGYLGDTGGGTTRIAGGQLFTGDAGFMAGGELFVIGRIADSVKVRGQSVYVEQIEDNVASVVQLPPHRCAVIPGHDAEGETIIAIVAAMPDDAQVTAAAAVLMGVCGAGARVKVYCVGKSDIPMTTSGKKRRRLLAEAILAGTFTGQLRYDSATVVIGS